MKEFKEKLPYVAPKIKVVSFKVERGFNGSVEVNSYNGLKGQMDQAQADAELMWFISNQQIQGKGARMGDQMDYFSQGDGDYFSYDNYYR